MHARSGLLRVAPDKIDEVVRVLADEQIPQYQAQNGYKGFTALADRSTGKVFGVSFWESADDLRASDALGEESRNRMQEAGGGTDVPVRATWEVVLDDAV